MNAKLITPVSGQTNVSRNAKISILFPSGDKEFVNIKIDGEYAVKDGQTTKKYITIESFNIGNKIKWSIRRRSPLPKSDIFVDARSSPSCYTVEQRFFTKGAKVEKEFSPDYKNWCLTKSGVYSCAGTPTRTRVQLEKFVSQELIDSCNHADFAIYDTGWRFVGCQDDKTILVGNDVEREFNFTSENPRIEKDLISVETDMKTLHLPFGYVPTRIEDEWYSMRKLKENVIFRMGIHIHWDESGFITRVNPCPISKRSEDMIWESQDIGEAIKSIEVKSVNKIIVNDHKLIHTRHPKIEKL